MRVLLPRPSGRTLLIAAVLAVGVAGWFTADRWLPAVGSALTSVAADDHAGHDHDHGEPADEVTLSAEARRTIGLKTGKVTPGEYVRTVSIPGMVVERPGRTALRVVTPLTGIVTDVFAVPGQAVRPGDLLFILRLNRDEIVTAQVAFLETLEALDVENREIARLEAIRSGVIAEKEVLARRYERQKLEGRLKAQRQALLLLGLSESQVDGIAESRTLLREYRLYAPRPHDATAPGHLEAAHDGREPAPAEADHPLVMTDLLVHEGESAAAGEVLCELADLHELYVEGHAYERDAAALTQAVASGRPVAVAPDAPAAELIEGLEIAYLANTVDPATRTQRFYVRLPNEIAADARPVGEPPADAAAGGRRFVTWRYKPGQRMDVLLPVERWQGRIVLPAAAVADDGAESYVFAEKGRRFVRRPVAIAYRDRDAVVLADGTLPRGLTLALNGAHQLQMALKAKAGGGVDPHHGHAH